MSVSKLFVLIAVICFVLAFFSVPFPFGGNLLALGLAFWAASGLV